MALSRKVKLALGGTALAGAAAVAATGMAFASAEEPTLRITETVDGGVRGAADGTDGDGCRHDDGTDAGAPGSSALDR